MKRRDYFERLVARAIDDLPPAIQAQLRNVDVVVEDAPSLRQLRSAGVRPPDTLLGLYEGIPLTERTSSYGMVLPDKITIFRRPIERSAATPEAIVELVQTTVVHEFAHHFGISDAQLEAWGWG